MRFGHFDDLAREYVVERPDTPLPWINYLGTEELFGFVSNTAGGATFFRDARLRRLTRYRYNNAPPDVGARFLYVRDDESGEFWSPTFQPCRSELDRYECRHGLSYTTIASARGGIGVESRYFVPLGERVEVWRVAVTNERPSPAVLSLFAAVEFCLWDAADDATNFQRNFSTGEVEVAGRTIFHTTEYRERRDHFAYFACSEEPFGYDTDRDAFLGPSRGWDRPIAVERGSCGGSVAHGWAPIGAHQVRLELEPGESKVLVFLLGYFENPAGEKFDPPGSTAVDKRAALQVVERWLETAAVDEAFDALRARWDGLLDTLQVSTPDPDVDRTVNLWNPYQCVVTFNLSRSISLFESGIGRGMGFRDSNQDLLGFVHLLPDRARERLLDLAATQLASGGAYHQYQPLTKRGNDAIGTGFNDDPLWLVLATAAYLKETGDDAVLVEQVPYDNEPGTESSLYEHLRRAIGYTLARLGPHGLPLIGRADWNDCLNLNCYSSTPGEPFQTTENRAGGVAESVFIAGQFVLAATELAAVALRAGHIEDAASYEESARAMAEAVERDGWDGEWFLRAYDYSGKPVGSHMNDEGQIYVEPQGMCVMAGIGVDDGRAASALRSVRERLETVHGIVLHQPAYTRYRLEYGEISSYPPGYKENAGVFCHANPWVMIAEAVVRDGDAAFAHYRLVNPSVREAASEVHRCEPYVYAQMIAGRDAPTFGEAKNSWLTGAAAWNFVAMTQWILGVRPELGGLRVDPVLPSSWPGFRMRRRWRGATYEIVVRQVPGRTGRACRLLVDGRVVEGNLVPPAAPGSAVLVEVELD